MSDGALHTISERIGELSGRIDGLQQTQAMARNLHDSAHSEIVSKLTKIDDRLLYLGAVQHAVDTHDRRINQLEHDAADYKAMKNRAIGAGGLLGAIGGAVWWALAKLFS